MLYLARRGGDSSFLPFDGRDRCAGFLALRRRRRGKQRRPRVTRRVPVLRSRHLPARRADPRGCDRPQPGLERRPRPLAAAPGSHRSARHRRATRDLPAGRRRLRRDPARHEGKLADRHVHALAVDRAQPVRLGSDRLDDRAGARLPAGSPAHEGRLLDRIARRLGRAGVARRLRAPREPVRHAGGESARHRAADAQSEHSLVPRLPGLHVLRSAVRARGLHGATRRNDHRRARRCEARAQPAALCARDVSHASRRAGLRGGRRPRRDGGGGAARVEHAVPGRLQGRRRSSVLVARRRAQRAPDRDQSAGARSGRRQAGARAHRDAATSRCSCASRTAHTNTSRAARRRRWRNSRSRSPPAGFDAAAARRMRPATSRTKCATRRASAWHASSTRLRAKATSRARWRRTPSWSWRCRSATTRRARRSSCRSGRRMPARA